jgi:zinc transport system substrate-binding protein
VVRSAYTQRTTPMSIGLAATLMAATSLVGCDEGRTPEHAPPSSFDRSTAGADPLRVYTVSYPLAYFAERLGGVSVDVRFPAPKGVDPADWSPEPAIVAGYQSADLVLLNGAGYARWTQRATLPRSALVDTSAAFADSYIEGDSAVTHTHGPGGEHSHAELAFTTWLDPRLAVEQARAVEEALSARRPWAAADIDERMTELRRDLESIDTRLSSLSEQLRHAGGVYSHPVYQYLDRRYALGGRALHWEPREDPGSQEWAAFEHALEARPATVMLWEGEPITDTRQRLRQLDVTSVVFPTLANAPAGADYIDDMNAAVDRLAAAIGAR